MRKEDYQSTAGFPVDIIFVPEALHIDFKEKIKLQIAFYRNNKVCKGSPAKFLKQNCKNGMIRLQPQKLQFCTTLAYENEKNHFQSKTINVQVAFQTDASKETIEGKIDLKDILIYQPSFQQNNLVVNLRNDIKLFYKIIVKIANCKPLQRQRSTSQLNKNKEKQPQFDTPKKLEHTQKEVLIRASQEKQNENIRKTNNEKSVKEKQLQGELQAMNKKIKMMEDKLRQTIRKYDDMVEQNGNYKMKLKQSQSSLQQKQKQVGQMQKLLQRVTEQKNTLLSNFGKGHTNEQQASKKLIQQTEKLSNQMNVLKELNNEYKNKISDLKKCESEMGAKYQQSLRKNVSLTAQIEQLKYKFEKAERQNEKNLKKLQKLQKQMLDNPQSNTGKSEFEQAIKAKQSQIQKLSKILETKEQIIRMLKKQTELKKNQQDDDLNILKKQNKDLKQQIQRLKDPKKDATYIELKVLNERLKKQTAEAKRQQKKMLTEKAQIQAKSKQMHQQIVRLKESIGRMLNVVQEEGSSDLFTLVADCVS